MPQLTKEEALKKYGKVPLKFKSYYKYVFSYRGIAPDNADIYYSEGGNADDIYRHEVTSETIRTMEDEGYRYLIIRLDAEIIYEDSNTGWF